MMDLATPLLAVAVGIAGISADHSDAETTWYCHECQLYLCHTGDADSDCFLQ